VPRSVAKASRRFIEYKLSQGYSPSAIREAHNVLVSHKARDDFMIEQRLYRHRELSEKDFTRAYDRWRVYARRHPGSTEAQRFTERRLKIAERRVNYRIKSDQRTSLGLPLPPEPIHAADAGMLYRITHDERYREWFEEGSP